MINWKKNAAYLGQTLTIFLLWISSWSVVEMTVDEYVRSYALKMVIYACIFIFAALIILLFASHFFSGI
jgi:hypothetical protein